MNHLSRCPSLAPFNLVTFDAARYAGAAPPTLEVVGHKLQIMGPPVLVTNYFSLTSGDPDFQTLYPDSSFMNVFQVEIYSPFSLDNLVISGVPGPSIGALAGRGRNRERGIHTGFFNAEGVWDLVTLVKQY